MFANTHPCVISGLLSDHGADYNTGFPIVTLFIKTNCHGWLVATQSFTNVPTDLEFRHKVSEVCTRESRTGIFCDLPFGYDKHKHTSFVLLTINNNINKCINPINPPHLAFLLSLHVLRSTLGSNPLGPLGASCHTWTNQITGGVDIPDGKIN